MDSRERILAAGLAAVTLVWCITPVYSENIFWHLRNGEDILDTGTVRVVDPFTWTMRGREWIQQEWLAEVAFAAGWRAGGPLGLSIVKAAVVLAAVMMAAAAARRRGAGFAGIALVAVLWLAAAQARWFERPHIFTDMYFSAYLLILVKRPKPLIALAVFVPLQILWVNTHAGFMTGLFLLFLPALDLLWAKRIRDAAEWLSVPAAALLCSGVHPNGFRSLTYLPDFLRQPLFRESIREWWSPFDPRFGSAYLPVLLVSLVASSAILIASAARKGNGRRLPVSALVMLAGLAVASSFAARNAELLALAAISTLPALLGRVPWGVPASALCAAALIPPIFGLPREFGPPREFGLGIAWEIYPVGLADFIEHHGLYGKVFNTNEISGYIEYRFGERLPLYMDGRCLLYPQSFYADYLFLARAPDSLSANVQLGMIEESGIEIALYDWPEQRGSTANLLAELPGWEPVYWDRLTVAYARRDWLAGMGAESLSTGAADPLSAEDLLSRPLYMVHAGMMPELLTACGMEGWDAPGVVACCLAWRDGDEPLAGDLAGSLEDADLREEALAILSGEAGASGLSDTWPQLATLGVWVAASEGRFPEAASVAEESGDAVLASSILIHGGVEPSEMTGPPPPWVPDDAWRSYRAGTATPAEAAAVRASAAFAAGDAAMAVREARSPGPDDAGRPWSLSVRAMVLASAGHVEEGMALADSAAGLSSNPFTLLAAGRIRVTAGRADEAVRLFERAAVMAPQSGDAALELASARWESGLLAASVAEYTRAASLGVALPPSGISRLGWGTVLTAGGGS